MRVQLSANEELELISAYRQLHLLNGQLTWRHGDVVTTLRAPYQGPLPFGRMQSTDGQALFHLS